MARQQIEKQKAEARAATRKENKEKKGEAGTSREGLRDVKKGEVVGKRKRGEAGRKKVKVEDEVSYIGL